MDHGNEKFISPDEKVHAGTPAVETHGEHHTTNIDEWRDNESFATRNGLNLKSFQRRPKGGPLVVLDKSMKTRHLHMIAIGGSIGAGFFVGSGGSLNTGGPASVLIDFSLMGVMIFNVSKFRLDILHWSE